MSKNKKPEWKQIMEERGVGEYDEYDEYDESVEVSEFPVSALPRPCANLTREAAASIVCPPEFVGLPLLTIFGCAIGNSRRLKIKEGWDEGTALYAAVVGDPGDKKTPAYKVASRAVVKQETKFRKEYRDAAADHKDMVAEYERAKKDKDPHADELEPGPEPKHQRVMVEDTTVEALASILETNPRGVFVSRDELSGWVRGMDQYRSGGKGNDRQFWLSAWTNTYASVDRKGSADPIVIPQPFVGVFGSIQPDILPELAGGREDGFLDRFLFSFPDPIRTRYSEDEITPTTVGNVKWLYEKVLDLDMGLDEYEEPEPTFITMTSAAKELFVSLIDSLREEMEMPGFPTRLKGPYAKLEAYLARLSLIIAVCRFVASPEASERVEQEDVLRASLLLGYFKAHAKKVYVGLYGQSTEDRLAEVVTLFLEEQGGEWEGEPGVLLKALKTKAKPEHPKDLAKVLTRIARRTPALSFVPPKSVNYTKEDGTRSKKRVMKISLDYTDSAYSAYSAYSHGEKSEESVETPGPAVEPEPEPKRKANGGHDLAKLCRHDATVGSRCYLCPDEIAVAAEPEPEPAEPAEPEPDDEVRRRHDDPDQWFRDNADLFSPPPYKPGES